MKLITFRPGGVYYLLYKSNKATHKGYFELVGYHDDKLKFMLFTPKITLIISHKAASQALLDGLEYLERKRNNKQP